MGPLAYARLYTGCAAMNQMWGLASWSSHSQK